VGGRQAWEAGQAWLDEVASGAERSGGIVARVLTDSNVDDASTGPDPIEQVDSCVLVIRGGEG